MKENVSSPTLFSQIIAPGLQKIRSTFAAHYTVSPYDKNHVSGVKYCTEASTLHRDGRAAVRRLETTVSCRRTLGRSTVHGTQ
ncbi:hypothetical protein Bpfe_008653 [Biomphalaria pfeifferi]|uniref:Uncharacterized protein n=1 Tax=Biomphalaria pfeifferi TaxID=112525 RepID=A0AAD8BW25_BIOPF|nr:hypothetical protein Bpfe_008653 [Biomphalaria pfeifferi]